MKWFRVATEGATTDGRKISRQWIEQMAKNFDPKKYGARIWMEHLRGLFHDGPFAALGDVTALKTEEVDGKLTLLAQLDPTEELKQINKKRQKIYTSIEVDPEFADTGEAYFVGLAVTDSPASLGTEMLQFSAQQGQNSPLSARKQRPENVFTAAIEIDLADLFAEENEQDDKPSLLDSVKALFTKHKSKVDTDFSTFRTDLEETMGLIVEQFSALKAAVESSTNATPGEEFNTLKSAHDELQNRFDELYTKLDNEPDLPSRKPATGGDGVQLTDC